MIKSPKNLTRMNVREIAYFRLHSGGVLPQPEDELRPASERSVGGIEEIPPTAAAYQ